MNSEFLQSLYIGQIWVSFCEGDGGYGLDSLTTPIKFQIIAQ